MRFRFNRDECYCNQQIIDGIKEKCPHIINYLHELLFPWLVKHILNNSGSVDDAKDVFQQTMLIICKKVFDDQLILTSSFGTYFKSICINQWLICLHNRKAKTILFENLRHSEKEELNNTGFEINKFEQYKLYIKHYNALNKDCQQILKLRNDDISFKEIQQFMGLQSEGAARKKHFDSKKKLIESIRKDPLYKKLIKNEDDLEL